MKRGEASGPHHGGRPPSSLRLTGLSLASAAVVVALACLAALVPLPYLAARQWPISEQLAFAQVALAFLALILAAGFGYFAIEQVRLARLAITTDLGDREEARAAEKQRVLIALLGELAENRTLARAREEGLWLGPTVRDQWVWEFKRGTFDQVAEGPLWGIATERDVWLGILEAYNQMRALTAHVRPWHWAVPAFAGVAGALQRPFGSPIIGLSLGVGPFLVWLRLNERSAHRSRRILKTREAIDAAIDAILRELGKPPADWDPLDAVLLTDLRKRSRESP